MIVGGARHPKLRQHGRLHAGTCDHTPLDTLHFAARLVVFHGAPALAARYAEGIEHLGFRKPQQSAGNDHRAKGTPNPMAVKTSLSGRMGARIRAIGTSRPNPPLSQQ